MFRPEQSVSVSISVSISVAVNVLPTNLWCDGDGVASVDGFQDPSRDGASLRLHASGDKIGCINGWMDGSEVYVC